MAIKMEGWRGSWSGGLGGKAVLENWTAVSAAGAVSISGDSTPRGSMVSVGSYYLPPGPYSGYFTWTPKNQDTTDFLSDRCILGFRAQCSTADLDSLLIISDASNSILRLIPAASQKYKLQKWNGSSWADIATSTSTPNDGLQHYFEVKVILAASGTFEMHCDGTQIMNVTATDLRGVAGSTSIHSFTFGPTSSGGVDGHYLSLGDIVLQDMAGGDNTFLGDHHVETVLVTGAGSHADFTPKSGSNYSQVSERKGDGDTSYNESSVVGDKDSFTHEALVALSGTPVAVAVYAIAEKTETPTRGGKTLVRSGGSEAQGDETLLLTPSNGGYTKKVGVTASGSSLIEGVFKTDPSTGSAWTITGVNNSEIGYTVST